MKFTFDSKYNIAYLSLKKKRENVESIKVGEDLIVDMAPDGTLYGIEFLNAKEQLFKSNTSKLTIVNEETGQQKEMQLHMSKSKKIYVERRPEGDYAVRREGSDRASAIAPTQEKAIEKARKLEPDATPHVERVRDTKAGGRDKWRKQ